MALLRRTCGAAVKAAAEKKAAFLAKVGALASQKDKAGVCSVTNEMGCIEVTVGDDGMFLEGPTRPCP